MVRKECLPHSRILRSRRLRARRERSDYNPAFTQEPRMNRAVALLGLGLATFCEIVRATPKAQATSPTNSAPNPYTTIEHFFKMPDGRTWGSTSAVEIDKDGRSIWVAERCGVNSCLDRATGQMSNLPSILKFDAAGETRRELRPRLARLSARHSCRPRRQPLGDRRSGRRATADASGAGRCGNPLRSTAGIDAWSSGLQIQSRWQAAHDAG